MDKLHLNHATIWFEEHPDKVQKWAILEENGRIGPNCFFDTQDQARRWRDSWGHGTLVTRSGQHGKWIPVPDEQE